MENYFQFSGTSFTDAVLYQLNNDATFETIYHDPNICPDSLPEVITCFGHFIRAFCRNEIMFSPLKSPISKSDFSSIIDDPFVKKFAFELSTHHVAIVIVGMNNPLEWEGPLHTLVQSYTTHMSYKLYRAAVDKSIRFTELGDNQRADRIFHACMHAADRLNQMSLDANEIDTPSGPTISELLRQQPSTM